MEYSNLSSRGNLNVRNKIQTLVTFRVVIEAGIWGNLPCRQHCLSPFFCLPLNFKDCKVVVRAQQFRREENNISGFVNCSHSMTWFDPIHLGIRMVEQLSRLPG